MHKFDEMYTSLPYQFFSKGEQVRDHYKIYDDWLAQQPLIHHEHGHTLVTIPEPFDNISHIVQVQGNGHETAVKDRETFLTGGFTRGIETTNGLGGFIAEAVTYGLPLDESTTYAGKIEATTPESLQAVARSTLGSQRAYVVVVGESSVFVDQLKVKHPDLIVIPSSTLDLGSAGLGVSQ